MKHPIWVRIAHWLNFPMLFLMIWSGLLIYWANDVYGPFFPEWVYSSLRIDHRLAEGMAIHFLVMIPFTLNGLLYLGYLFASGEWQELAPRRESPVRAWQQTLHEFGACEPPRARGRFLKFNDAQKIAYTSVIALGALAVLSGFAIYKPVQLHALSVIFGGYNGARLVHFIVMLAFVAFTLIHVVQVARAGFENFRGMIAGFEIHDAE